MVIGVNDPIYVTNEPLVSTEREYWCPVTVVPVTLSVIFIVRLPAATAAAYVPTKLNVGALTTGVTARVKIADGSVINDAVTVCICRNLSAEAPDEFIVIDPGVRVPE